MCPLLCVPPRTASDFQDLQPFGLRPIYARKIHPFLLRLYSVSSFIRDSRKKPNGSLPRRRGGGINNNTKPYICQRRRSPLVIARLASNDMHTSHPAARTHSRGSAVLRACIAGLGVPLEYFPLAFFALSASGLLSALLLVTRYPQHYESVLRTHCDARVGDGRSGNGETIPSISATIGDHSPERVVWQLAVAFALTPTVIWAVAAYLMYKDIARVTTGLSFAPRLCTTVVTHVGKALQSLARKVWVVRNDDGDNNAASSQSSPVAIRKSHSAPQGGNNGSPLQMLSLPTVFAVLIVLRIFAAFGWSLITSADNLILHESAFGAYIVIGFFLQNVQVNFCWRQFHALSYWDRHRVPYTDASATPSSSSQKRHDGDHADDVVGSDATITATTTAAATPTPALHFSTIFLARWALQSVLRFAGLSADDTIEALAHSHDPSAANAASSAAMAAAVRRDIALSYHLKWVSLIGQTMAAAGVGYFIVFEHATNCLPGAYSRACTCEWAFAFFNLAFDATMALDLKHLQAVCTFGPPRGAPPLSGHVASTAGPIQPRPTSSSCGVSPDDASSNCRTATRMMTRTTDVERRPIVRRATGTHTTTTSWLWHATRSSPHPGSLWFADVWFGYLLAASALHSYQTIYYVPMVAMAFTPEVALIAAPIFGPVALVCCGRLAAWLLRPVVCHALHVLHPSHGLSASAAAPNEPPPPASSATTWLRGSGLPLLYAASTLSLCFIDARTVERRIMLVVVAPALLTLACRLRAVLFGVNEAASFRLEAHVVETLSSLCSRRRRGGVPPPPRAADATTLRLNGETILDKAESSPQEAGEDVVSTAATLVALSAFRKWRLQNASNPRRLRYSLVGGFVLCQLWRFLYFSQDPFFTYPVWNLVAIGVTLWNAFALYRESRFTEYTVQQLLLASSSCITTNAQGSSRLGPGSGDDQEVHPNRRVGSGDKEEVQPVPSSATHHLPFFRVERVAPWSRRGVDVTDAAMREWMVGTADARFDYGLCATTAIASVDLAAASDASTSRSWRMLRGPFATGLAFGGSIITSQMFLSSPAVLLRYLGLDPLLEHWYLGGPATVAATLLGASFVSSSVFPHVFRELRARGQRQPQNHDGTLLLPQDAKYEDEDSDSDDHTADDRQANHSGGEDTPSSGSDDVRARGGARDALCSGGHSSPFIVVSSAVDDGRNGGSRDSDVDGEAVLGPDGPLIAADNAPDMTRVAKRVYLVAGAAVLAAVVFCEGTLQSNPYVPVPAAGEDPVSDVPSRWQPLPYGGYPMLSYAAGLVVIALLAASLPVSVGRYLALTPPRWGGAATHSSPTPHHHQLIHHHAAKISPRWVFASMEMGNFVSFVILILTNVYVTCFPFVPGGFLLRDRIIVVVVFGVVVGVALPAWQHAAVVLATARRNVLRRSIAGSNRHPGHSPFSSASSAAATSVVGERGKGASATAQWRYRKPHSADAAAFHRLPRPLVYSFLAALLLCTIARVMSTPTPDFDRDTIIVVKGQSTTLLHNGRHDDGRFIPSSDALVPAEVLQGSQTRSERGLTGSLKATLWTLHFGIDNFARDSLDRLSARIARTGASVVGLLESDLSRIVNGNRDLVEYLGYQLSLPFTDFGPTTKDSTFGCAMLSKYPIVYSRRYILPSPDGELACLLHAKIVVSPMLLDVAAHGAIPRGTEAKDAYLKSRRQVVNVFVGHFGNTDHAADVVLQAQGLRELIQSCPPGEGAMFLGYLTTSTAKGHYYHVVQGDGAELDHLYRLTHNEDHDIPEFAMKRGQADIHVDAAADRLTRLKERLNFGGASNPKKHNDRSSVRQAQPAQLPWLFRDPARDMIFRPASSDLFALSSTAAAAPTNLMPLWRPETATELLHRIFQDAQQTYHIADWAATWQRAEAAERPGGPMVRRRGNLQRRFVRAGNGRVALAPAEQDADPTTWPWPDDGVAFRSHRRAPLLGEDTWPDDHHAYAASTATDDLVALVAATRGEVFAAPDAAGYPPNYFAAAYMEGATLPPSTRSISAASASRSNESRRTTTTTAAPATMMMSRHLSFVIRQHSDANATLNEYEVYDRSVADVDAVTNMAAAAPPSVGVVGRDNRVALKKAGNRLSHEEMEEFGLTDSALAKSTDRELGRAWSPNGLPPLSEFDFSRLQPLELYRGSYRGNHTARLLLRRLRRFAEAKPDRFLQLTTSLNGERSAVLHYRHTVTGRRMTRHPRLEYENRYCQYILYRDVTLIDWYRELELDDLSDTEIQVMEVGWTQRRRMF